ncbi:MAG TPA: ABC transporter ATP-binding protein [Candidatus Limnocylindria bacterium]|jgi:energy-coupling factor transport system ATP-binding protein|nr:ABC transporter ATP-binding protein [Candidatus Limnocylindria bacterium]
MLECRELTFRYPNGVSALNGVDFAVQPGESVAVVGQNGSGKTTLIKHFNGLLSPTSGVVLVKGRPIAGAEPADLATTVGLVFQNPADQIFQSKVEDEVAFGASRLGLTREEVDERVSQALAETGLSSVSASHPYDLTLSERKLLCFASVLAMKPEVIVLDEPTTAQDSLGVRQLVRIIGKLIGEGRTVIAVTHDMEFVAEVFARTVVMREGRIVLDGPTSSVFQQRDVLETAYVKPPSMGRLSQRLRLAETVLTVDGLVAWVVGQVGHRLGRAPS